MKAYNISSTRFPRPPEALYGHFFGAGQCSELWAGCSWNVRFRATDSNGPIFLADFGGYGIKTAATKTWDPGLWWCGAPFPSQGTWGLTARRKSHAAVGSCQLPAGNWPKYCTVGSYDTKVEDLYCGMTLRIAELPSNGLLHWLLWLHFFFSAVISKHCVNQIFVRSIVDEAACAVWAGILSSRCRQTPALLDGYPIVIHCIN